MLRVVGDAVQYRFVVDPSVCGHQAGEVDPAEDVSIPWRNSRDPIRVPDVRVDLTFDKLELIERLHGMFAVLHHDVAGLLEGFGITEAQSRGAVAGDDRFRRARHAPALAAIRELPGRAEREPVEDQTDMRLPGPLVNVGTPVDDAFAEVLLRQIALLHNFAGLRLNDQDRGATLQPGAFVEKASR
jgi:hypothetical protein